MNVNQFIRIGEKVFPAESICQLLGIEPTGGMKISVGRTAVGGTLEASVALGYPDEYFDMEVHYNPVNEAPILLSHVEQHAYDKEGKAVPQVRTFLYDRTESYVGYIIHNICLEEEQGDGRMQTKLVASGDKNVVVNVYQENPYAKWKGPLV